MKAGKIFLWLQIVCMYALHALIWTLVKPVAEVENSKALEIAFFVLSALVAFFVIVNGICALLSVFKDHENPTKTVLAIKLAAIPWYVANFYFWVGLAAGFLNPFLMIGLPIVIALGVRKNKCFPHALRLSLRRYSILSFVWTWRELCGSTFF